MTRNCAREQDSACVRRRNRRPPSAAPHVTPIMYINAKTKTSQTCLEVCCSCSHRHSYFCRVQNAQTHITYSTIESSPCCHVDDSQATTTLVRMRAERAPFEKQPPYNTERINVRRMLRPAWTTTSRPDGSYTPHYCCERRLQAASNLDVVPVIGWDRAHKYIVYVSKAPPSAQCRHCVRVRTRPLRCDEYRVC